MRFLFRLPSTGLILFIQAPVFFTAGIYILLGRLITVYGYSLSYLHPDRYLQIFLACDCVSLLLQGIGGTMASVAMNRLDGNTAPGTHTMLAGIIFQAASTTVFMVCALSFTTRALKSRRALASKWKLRTLLGAMAVTTTCIQARCVYRTIELFQGWKGYLITREMYMVWFDAVLMLIASGIMTLAHPGWLLPEKQLKGNDQGAEEDGRIDSAPSASTGKQASVSVN